MADDRTKPSIQILVIVTFLTMIIVNALANILPINGQTTGEVSDHYRNLFTPTGLTFAVWGVIYLVLGIYTFFQTDIFRRVRRSTSTILLNRVGAWFAASSVANTAWIFAWHYQLIPLSVLLIVAILFCLIMISLTLRRERLTVQERLFVKVPFSIYFGWITVAAIANIAVLLVSLGWNGFGLSEAAWMVIVVLLGLALAWATMLHNSDPAYGLTVIWVYSGILMKHVSPVGFDREYPMVIWAVIASIVLLLLVEAYLLIFRVLPLTDPQES